MCGGVKEQLNHQHGSSQKGFLPPEFLNFLVAGLGGGGGEWGVGGREIGKRIPQ